MRAGPMRHRIVIQSDTPTVSTSGHVTRAWGTFATVWARVKTLTGDEQIASQRERATAQSRFEIRYKAGVTPAMRVSWDSRIFDILEVRHVDERKKETHLVTEEVAA